MNSSSLFAKEVNVSEEFTNDKLTVSYRLKFTVKIIFLDATIGNKNYTICKMHLRNIFPKDWGQPISLYTTSNIGFYSKALFCNEQFRTPIMCDSQGRVTFVDKIFTEQNFRL